MTRPVAELGLEISGIPVLHPAVVLLYKAKHTSPRDQADYDAVAPLLPAAERRWLRHALRIAQPGHPWLDEEPK